MPNSLPQTSCLAVLLTTACVPHLAEVERPCPCGAEFLCCSGICVDAALGCGATQDGAPGDPGIDGGADGDGAHVSPADSHTVLKYLTFYCTDDIHVQNGAIVDDDEFLRVENSTRFERVRDIFLRFEVAGVGEDPIVGAALRMRNVDEEARSGTYLVSLGEHGAWSETSTLAELPDREGQPIGSLSGPVPLGTMLSWTLPETVGRDGPVTLIMHMDLDTGDDLALAASEGLVDQAELDLAVLRSAGSE